jgi:hypothetical protein
MIGIVRSVIHRFTLPGLSSTTLIAITIITCAAIAVGARVWVVKQPVRETKAATIQPTPPRIEVELIELTPLGFEPLEIKRPKGRFLIAINNHTGLVGEITLSLSSVAGDYAGEININSEKRKLSKLVDLQSGQYRLTEANHKEWMCKLTIIDE